MKILLNSLRTAESAHMTSVTLCNLSEMSSFLQSHLHPVENITVNPLSSVQASYIFQLQFQRGIWDFIWLAVVCHRNRMLQVIDHDARGQFCPPRPSNPGHCLNAQITHCHNLFAIGKGIGTYKGKFVTNVELYHGSSSLINQPNFLKIISWSL